MKSKKPDTVKEATSGRSAIWLGIISGVVAIVIALIQFNPWKHSTEKPSVKEELPENLYVIAGTVVDAGTNKSVELAEVSIVGRTEVYLTEGNGNFRIQLKGINSSAGQFRIRVTKPGYAIYDRTLTPPVEDMMIALEKKR